MNNSFLQSKCWGEFQQSLGRQIYWIDKKLLIKIPSILNQTYLYSPRAYFSSNKELENFINKTKKIAKDNNSFFLRFEPIFAKDIDASCYNLKKVKSYQPQNSLVIKLDNSLENILANMHPKTRYNIRLAEKKGVKIVKSTKTKDINIFYNIARETAQRDKIKFYPKEYYYNLAKTFIDHNKLIIYLAKYNDQYIAANLILNYGTTSTYLYGASSSAYRNVMAPYLLQFRAIKDAKKNNYRFYDFWGIAPLTKNQNKFIISDQKHNWMGISRFKLGFAPNDKNGIYIQYPGCFELSFGKKRYLLYSMFKKVIKN